MSNDIPAELLGAWSQGSVPITTDPGNWWSTTGSGFLFEFAQDGTYVFAGILTAAGMTEASWEHGGYTVAGDQLTLAPIEEQVRQPDGSISTDQPGPRSYRWQVGTDEIGSVILVLVDAQGQPDTFYR